MNNEERIQNVIDKNNVSSLDVIKEIEHSKRMGYPVGHRLVIRLYEEEEITSGGLRLPQVSIDEGEFKTCVGLVVQKGPEAYKDNSRPESFKDWCEVGDWVIFVRNAGAVIKVKMDGATTFIVNDDQIYFVANDPKLIKR